MKKIELKNSNGTFAVDSDMSFDTSFFAKKTNAKNDGNNWIIENPSILNLEPSNSSLPYLITLLCKTDVEGEISVKYNGKTACSPITIDNRDWEMKEILLPPSFGLPISIVLPKMTFLSADFRTTLPRKAKSNYLIAAHLGAYLGYNTKRAFSLAGTMGFNACVSNIMTTADGVLVCAHNPTFVGKDGATYTLSQKTLAEINQLGWYETEASSYNKIWASTFNEYAITTIDDFLHICAKNGMHPLFSIHPSYMPDWNSLDLLLRKNGFLSRASFTLKFKGAISSAFTAAYAVFGNRARYMNYDYNQSVSKLNSLISLDLGDSVKAFECSVDSTHSMSDEIISTALANKIELSVADGSDDKMTVSTGLFKYYIRKGVTGTTSDGLFGDGMNW